MKNHKTKNHLRYQKNRLRLYWIPNLSIYQVIEPNGKVIGVFDETNYEDACLFVNTNYNYCRGDYGRLIRLFQIAYQSKKIESSVKQAQLRIEWQKQASFQHYKIEYQHNNNNHAVAEVTLELSYPKMCVIKFYRKKHIYSNLFGRHIKKSFEELFGSNITIDYKQYDS